MIASSIKKKLHRLVMTCLHEEIIYANALQTMLHVPIAMAVLKEVSNSRDMMTLFEDFSGPCDIIVCLMTNESFNEMSTMLTQNETIIKHRSLVVIPIKIQPVVTLSDSFIDFFTSLPIVTCSGQLSVIAEKVSCIIKNYLNVDLGKFQPFEFDNLVKSVLEAYGFESITWCSSDHIDFGYDLMCSYQRNDTIGRTQGNWFVEIKYTLKNRFTIRGIDNLIKKERVGFSDNDKLMLVTNGILTSVINDYLAELEKEQGISILIVDGWKLCNLIALNDNLMKEFFPYE